MVVHPLLSRTREDCLFRAYAAHPSVVLRNSIVQRNAGLVRQIARCLSRKCTEPYEDLVQIGFLGLIRAVERFDPDQGCAFSSFASPYIRGEMLHFLRDCGHLVRLPRRWQELYRSGQQWHHRLAEQLGHPPSEAELAQALEISPTEWRTICWARQNRSPLSLDLSLQQETGRRLTLAETLPDPQGEQSQQRAENWQVLETALSSLEQETRLVLEGVFLGDRTRRELAHSLGVSPMTISRRIQRGLTALLAQLGGGEAAGQFSAASAGLRSVYLSP